MIARHERRSTHYRSVQPTTDQNPLLPLHVFWFSHRIIIAATISAASFLLAGVFLYQGNVQALAQRIKITASQPSSDSKVYLDASGIESIPAVAEKASMREMHISNNGLILLRGTRVISISGSVVRVGMAWDDASFTWTIKTDSRTDFFTSEGEKTTLTGIHVDDVVTLTGRLISGGAEPTIHAEFVRQ